MRQLVASLIFHAMTVLSLVVYAPLVVLSFPFPFEARYRFAIQWGRFMIWLARVLCGIRYEVEGREHLPASGGVIIMAKHQSTWETFAFSHIFPVPLVFVLKRELMMLPFFGWGLALLEPIAIDRGAGRRAVEQVIKQGRERLQAGRWVAIFPEGTRVPRGKRRKYGIGASVLAAETGYPVIPVAHNAGTCWPRRSVRLYPGVIRVAIGPLIESKGKTPEAIRDEVETWIETRMMALEGRTEPAELITGRHPGK
jgi:1-acyl-sn-glycerol-3-phosphate acyltransferase